MKGEPDVTGLVLEDAIRELEGAGWTFDIALTRPDRVIPGGRKRVICFKPSGIKRGLLIVAFEFGSKFPPNSRILV